ncbi:MAG: hypothetical protein HYZ44_10195 [Bacteroidetes bacterium]|nr:hypothetical protein [Bacteroidota bacterium]
MPLPFVFRSYSVGRCPWGFYKKENKIDIPTVKAFYADVKFEQAKHGLIATTSFISDGGKKIVSARNYPLSFAENEDVKNWASAMWRYRKPERNS